jgi:hypothetical protein
VTYPPSQIEEITYRGLVPGLVGEDPDVARSLLGLGPLPNGQGTHQLCPLKTGGKHTCGRIFIIDKDEHIWAELLHIFGVLDVHIITTTTELE